MVRVKLSMLPIAAVFLVVSGMASLTYQVTWVRLLSLSMGSTSASISTVLAAFFLGMALGSYLAERITRNQIGSFSAYLIVEAVIGLSGALLLPILLKLDMVMRFLPELGTHMVWRFVVVIGLLLIPTLCMGATFPIMASILIRRQQEMGLRLGQLYSLNTAGAALGALLSGFVFIPYWGLDGAIYIAVALNFTIVLFGLYVNKRLSLPPTDIPQTAWSGATPVPIQGDAPLRRQATIVLCCTGLVAIATEVGWTKYLAIFTGTTIYGFAAILSVFLVGMAIGSWAIKSVLARLRSPQLWMAGGLVLLGASLILTRAGLSIVPMVYDTVNQLSAPGFVLQGVKYGFVFALMFLPTFLFGALFPLNLQLYCGSLSGVRTRIGKAYAINIVASVLGSILAGFWFIPVYGTDVLLTVMALVILIMPFLFLPAMKGLIPRLVIAGLAGICVISSWYLPHLNYQDLIASVDYKYDDAAQAGEEPKFLFLKEGKAGVISMVTYDGRMAQLQNNGIKEALLDLRDPRRGLITETLLGLLPYFLCEDPKSAFVVGFGGGTTTRALTDTHLESIRVVELEPAVVEAGRAITQNGTILALQDARVRLDFNDARNTLLVENQTYDIIVSQPSHPWLAGGANVFTREFFHIVNSRLNDGGIFGQWVNLFHMDATTLRAIFQAFFGVFPHGVSFANIDTGDLLLFGANDPLLFDYDRMTRRMALPQVKKTLAQYKIRQPQDLLWYFSLSRREALEGAGDMRPNTDTNILSEIRLAAWHDDLTDDEDPYAFLFKHFNLDLRPYLNPDQAAKQIYRVGALFLRRQAPERVKMAVERLKELDAPIMAGWLEKRLPDTPHTGKGT